MSQHESAATSTNRAGGCPATQLWSVDGWSVELRQPEPAISDTTPDRGPSPEPIGSGRDLAEGWGPDADFYLYHSRPECG